MKHDNTTQFLLLYHLLQNQIQKIFFKLLGATSMIFSDKLIVLSQVFPVKE